MSRQKQTKEKCRQPLLRTSTYYFMKKYPVGGSIFGVESLVSKLRGQFVYFPSAEICVLCIHT